MFRGVIPCLRLQHEALKCTLASKMAKSIAHPSSSNISKKRTPCSAGCVAHVGIHIFPLLMEQLGGNKGNDNAARGRSRPTCRGPEAAALRSFVCRLALAGSGCLFSAPLHLLVLFLLSLFCVFGISSSCISHFGLSLACWWLPATQPTLRTGRPASAMARMSRTLLAAVACATVAYFAAGAETAAAGTITFNETATFFGFMGAASALIFSCACCAPRPARPRLTPCPVASPGASWTAPQLCFDRGRRAEGCRSSSRLRASPVTAVAKRASIFHRFNLDG